MPDGIDDLTVRVKVIEEKVDGFSVSVEQRFDVVDRRFDAVDERFEQIDRRFEAVDRRFEVVDRRFDEVSEAIAEQREYTEFAFSRLEARMDAGFGRIERKLDQFIEVQLRTNELVDRRLTRFEGSSS